jgi:hypothetical protein
MSKLGKLVRLFRAIAGIALSPSSHQHAGDDQSQQAPRSYDGESEAEINIKIG